MERIQSEKFAKATAAMLAKQLAAEKVEKAGQAELELLRRPCPFWGHEIARRNARLSQARTACLVGFAAVAVPARSSSRSDDKEAAFFR